MALSKVDFKCHLCKGVCRVAFSGPCKHIACRSCWIVHLVKDGRRLDSTSCYFCGKNFSLEKITMDHEAEDQLQRCQRKCRSCDWEGSGKEYQNHERVCGNVERIQCKVFGCGKLLPKNRALMVHHADAWCPMILLMKTCFTEEEIHYFSTKETWDVTIKRVMETDKKNVKHLIERLIHIFRHFDSSSLPPDYEKADREEHVDHQVLLSQLLDSQLQVIGQRIELLQMIQESQRRIQDLECSHSGVFLWKIDNYSQRKKQAATTNTKSIYSPPFFTSQYGYKLCGQVFLMGDGVGIGTHISLFLTIMRGPYDAVQPWPFKEKITFQLVNQADPINRSIVESFRPDPTSSSFKRPTSERNIGAGFPLFVKIQQVEDLNQGFLKDDTLYLKIISQTSDVPQTNRVRGDILPVSS